MLVSTVVPAGIFPLFPIFKKKIQGEIITQVYEDLLIYWKVDSSPFQTCQHRKGVCGGVFGPQYR